VSPDIPLPRVASGITNSAQVAASAG